MNTTDFLNIAAAICPEQTAIIFEGKRYNFSQLNERVNRLANALMKLGVKKGDRVALLAVKAAREEGINVGMLRLVTVWPFPNERIREIADSIKAFVVPEINAGQVVLEVERCSAGAAQAILVPHMGGDVHDPQLILEAIRKASK